MFAHDAGSPLRLFDDGPAAGAWNMAVDEVLLTAAAAGRPAALRFYGWSEPTVSLGYFQSYRDRRQHIPSRDCPIVRRQTGGGAILHDRELTYCLVVPLAHPLAADATRLYRAVHEALASALSRFDIPTTPCTMSNAAPRDRPPFLCFQRLTHGDVLCGAHKVCGSAQRRRRGAILQHGSVLLAASPHAPELPGIRELTGHSPDARLLAESWRSELGRRLRFSAVAAGLDAAELNDVRALALSKYDTASWTERR